MRIGLFGFPQTGKSTLFRLLTGAQPAVAGARDAVQLGIAKVPDKRLTKLAEMHKPKKTTPATVEYMDLAAIEKGEAAEGLPLEQLRTVDALAHVVRAFRDESISHVEGSIDPARDAATMEMELLLADHTIADERRLEKLELAVKKAGRDEDKKDLEILANVSPRSRRKPAAQSRIHRGRDRCLRGFTFLTLKPLLIVVNADEADAGKLGSGPGGLRPRGVRDAAEHRGGRTVREDRNRDQPARPRRCRGVSRSARHRRTGAGSHDPRVVPPARPHGSGDWELRTCRETRR
jgi:ribosome-binding ATPase YchF (GTP1/OBG family)